MIGESALKQFEQRAHLAGTRILHLPPPVFRQGLDRNLDVVDVRPTDLRTNSALLDLQMADGTVSHVRPAARQAILIIAELLEVLAPGLAPECAGDLSPLDLHRLNVHALLAQLLHFLYGLGAALRHRHVRSPTPSIVTHLSILRGQKSRVIRRGGVSGTRCNRPLWQLGFWSKAFRHPPGKAKLSVARVDVPRSARSPL